MPTESKRAIIRLEMEMTAKRELDALSERRGMPQINILSRYVKWFAVQDDRLQGLVLGLLSESHRGEAAGRILERLAKGDERPTGRSEK